MALKALIKRLLSLTAKDSLPRDSGGINTTFTNTSETFSTWTAPDEGYIRVTFSVNGPDSNGGSVSISPAESDGTILSDCLRFGENATTFNSFWRSYIFPVNKGRTYRLTFDIWGRGDISKMIELTFVKLRSQIGGGIIKLLGGLRYA